MQTLFLLIILALFTVPFAVFGLWWWFALMICIVGLVVLFEFLCLIFTKMTLSQRFWKWSKSNKAKGWIVIGCLFAVWVMLLIHMAWGML